MLILYVVKNFQGGEYKNIKYPPPHTMGSNNNYSKWKLCICYKLPEEISDKTPLITQHVLSGNISCNYTPWCLKVKP